MRWMSATRKPGVASPAELAAFIARAGAHLAVVDARGSADTEPSSSLGALAPSAARPRAVSAPLDRATGALPLEAIPAAWIAAAGQRMQSVGPCLDRDKTACMNDSLQKICSVSLLLFMEETGAVEWC